MPIEMKERNQQLISERFEQGMTFQQLADKYEISKERVRQIIWKAGYVGQRYFLSEWRANTVYNFLVEFKKLHDGNTPTNPQMIEGCFGIENIGTIKRYLNILESEGRIRQREGWYNKVEIVGARWLSPEENCAIGKVNNGR